MADISDVSSALVTVIAGIAYPNGTSQPSISGVPVLVYSGWPDSVQLRADLAANKAHVSVFPQPNMLRIVDTAMSDWSTPTAPVNTVTLTLSGQTITVGGTVSTPQNAALVVDGKSYVYAVQAGDTPASIAAALAALVNADQTATAAGAVVTIPVAKYISPRVGGQGVAVRETRRQEQTYLITVWANCFDQRDPIAAAIDSALSGIAHLTLADQSAALRYKSSRQDDSQQKEGIYRRDLLYAVEFSTFAIQTLTQITATTENISAGPSLAAQFAVKTIVE
ncbi:putative phage protein [Ralstonia solanacearum CMR15]|nr:putative phage protein [Ralstonia solanacearum CMR15]